MTRLRFCVRLNPSKSEAGDLSKYGDVTFAPMDALSDGLGGLDTSAERSAVELAESNYSYFAEGDLLIAKVTPCFENGKKALVISLPNRIGFATSEVHVVRPHRGKVNPNYLRYLLSSEKFRAAGISSMTGAGGLRRISDLAIKDFILPIEGVENQELIAEFLDKEVGKLNRAIERAGGEEAAHCAAKGSMLALLAEKRAALITAAVTGQIDISERLPAAMAKPDRTMFCLVVGAEIIHRHQGNPKFGRVKLQKELYLAEAHLGISELQGNYLREAAGPLDRALIDETERALETAGYFSNRQPDGIGGAVTYTPLPKAGQHAADLEALLGSRANRLRGLINLLSDLDRRQVEAVATLYAVWNDTLMDGQQPDDGAIINGVLTEWHTEKGEKFKEADLSHWLDWMKRHCLTPRGQGPKTTTGRLFV